MSLIGEHPLSMLDIRGDVDLSTTGVTALVLLLRVLGVAEVDLLDVLTCTGDVPLIVVKGTGDVVESESLLKAKSVAKILWLPLYKFFKA